MPNSSLTAADEHPNPMWDVVRVIPSGILGNEETFSPDPLGAILALVEDEEVLNDPARHAAAFEDLVLREKVCTQYSWAIASPRALDWMVEQLGGRSVVEIGAGCGYWASRLALRGVDVTCYDTIPPLTGMNPQCAPSAYHEVLPGSSEVLGDHRDDPALFLCWPPMGEPMAARALRAHRGDMLVYCGEGPGGCTADADFFDQLAEEWELVERCRDHVSWSAIRDQLLVYRRL